MSAARSFVVLVVVLALLATSHPALADTRDIETVDLPFLACRATQPDFTVAPAPGSSANDGAFPHICWLKFVQQGPWQASTGEWILFDHRVGFAAQADCEAFAAAVTIDLDGGPVAVDTTSCQHPFPDGPWVVAFRFLSQPLPAGAHTATLAITPAGGPTSTFAQTLMVVPRG